MDRRKSIKALIVGTVSTGVVIEACNTTDNKAKDATAISKAEDGMPKVDRFADEAANDKRLLEQEDFFTPAEMATITVLADIIMPKDEVSGNASDAGVPAFIAFIVKDMPKHQIPMRGGLRWLDMQCLERYQKAFTDCTHEQQIAMVDEIAYPAKAKPNMKQGVSFFNLMRDLTVTGFYTTEIGFKDIGYMGNKANQWNGVPDDVLQQYGLAYSEKELKECISFS